MPILSFGQTITVEIDSVSLVRYSGSSKPRPKPKPVFQGKLHEDIKVTQAEREIILKNRHDELLSKYPNYNEERNMPLNRISITILNKEDKYHPTAKWETYYTFPSDSIKYLLKILDCRAIEEEEITAIDTIYTVDEKGDTIRDIIFTKTISNRPHAMCYAPGLGVLLWSKGRIVTFYSVCFGCNNVAEGPSQGHRPEFKRCINIHLLKEGIERLGYSLE